MSRNHFFISYTGNKRTDFKYILPNVNLDNVKTIVEPFCGSCAFSFLIAKLNPKKYIYHLNDNNNYLIDLLNIAKDKEKLNKLELEINEFAKQIKDKQTYLDIIKCVDNIYVNGFAGWFIKHKIYKIRAGLFSNLGYIYKYIDLENCPIVDFLRNENIIISCMDGIKILHQYSDDITSFLFIDPPYMMTDNTGYDVDYDNINRSIYEELYYNNNHKCKIILTLEKNWIMDLLFQKWNKYSFAKIYNSYSKRKVILYNITNY